MFRIITTIILLAAAIGSFFVYTQPTYQEAKVLKTQEESFNQALANAKQLQAVRGDLTKSFNAFSAQDLEKLNKLLPNSAGNIRFINDLEKIAIQRGLLRPYNVKFATEREEITRVAREEVQRDYNVFNLEFTTYGNYGDLVDFLKDLEKDLRIVDISSLSFSSVENIQKEFPNFYVYDFNIKTYWLRI